MTLCGLSESLGIDFSLRSGYRTFIFSKCSNVSRAGDLAEWSRKKAKEYNVQKPETDSLCGAVMITLNTATWSTL